MLEIFACIPNISLSIDVIVKYSPCDPLHRPPFFSMELTMLNGFHFVYCFLRLLHSARHRFSGAAHVYARKRKKETPNCNHTMNAVHKSTTISINMLFNELKNIFRSDQPHNVIIKLVHPTE